MLDEKDTIAAIATARGAAALSVVRVSGDRTAEIIRLCFSNKNVDVGQSHKAHYGFWEDPVTKNPIDEVVLLRFSDGKGFTGETSAEIICHGGMQVTDLVLEAALKAGARMARPGEFTYRAVMNNKMDLPRAEGTLDLIRAKSPRAASNALNNLRGALSDQVAGIEESLIFILAHLEASIDFTTEDIQPVSFKEMGERVDREIEKIKKLLQSFISGRVAAQGLRAVLAGKPNGGKSSLLNALVGKDRSIVSETPGTTRDTVEEEFLIDGNLFRLVDTAGIRSAENDIEKQGIDRTHLEVSGADLVLYIVDSAQGLQNDDVNQIKQIGKDRAVICFNKSDISQIEKKEALTRFGLVDYISAHTSAKNRDGTGALKKVLVGMIDSTASAEMSSVVSTQRQRECLLGALVSLEKAQELLSHESVGSPEFVAFEVKAALLKLQELLGKDASDDVMDRVFKEFCIGK